MPQKPLTIVAEEPLTIVNEEPLSVVSKKPTIPPASGPAPWSLDMLAQSARTTSDPAVGALKGVANTVIGMGQAAYRHVPGVAAASSALGLDGEQAFTQARAAVQPTNTAQQIGYTAEQIGEFFVPVARAGKALKLAKDVGLSYLQTGDPTTAATTGLIGAASPYASAMVRGTGKILARGAQKSVAQALGATKEWAKSDAAKLAPEVIARGVSGTRSAMLEQAEQAVSSVGPRIGRIYEAAGKAGKTISGQVIRGELQFAGDALKVPNAKGVLTPIPGYERVVRKLDKLDRWVETLGDDVPVHHAAKIATMWGKIVSKSGLFGPKAMASAADNADAWAVREGTGQFRRLLNDVDTTLPALNAEFSFWKGLRNVLKETEQRTQAQSGGLLNAVGSSSAGAAGAMATMLSGGGPAEVLTGAFATQAATHQFLKLVRSPWWKTSISAPMKDHMARALASGSKGQAAAALARMTAALPSQARQALAN